MPRYQTKKKSQCKPREQVTKIEKCLIRSAESEIRIAVLEQERPYIIQLRDNVLVQSRIATSEIEISKCYAESTILEKKSLDDNSQLEINREEQRQVKHRGGRKCKIKGTSCLKKLKRLKNLENNLSNTHAQSSKQFQDKQQECKDLKLPEDIITPVTDIDIAVEMEKVLAPLRDKISELKVVLNTNWLRKLFLSIDSVIHTAALILTSIIVMPFVIKLFLYFLIAPLASRRSSHSLLPDTSGTIDRFSEAAKTIDVASADELLIHPDYVLFAPNNGSKDIRWLLDYKFPLSSLASGMYALTRFRHDSGGTYGIAPMKDPLAKLAVIAIPPGSAFVLQPRCLIGIVQRRDLPVTITRHWRLTSLHAWLTLQLRYLVFHGPVTLIVVGCGGVSIGEAGQGRSVNQAATIGFSANLPYATNRAEPFAAYLMGKQELFNDTFPSGSGYFVYENTPLFDTKSNPITGRGLEGFMDSVFKVFGL